MRSNTIEDFWQKIEKTNNCWIWKGSTLKNFGRFKLKGITCIVHRFIWKLYYGEIPDDSFVQLCHNNKLCVNPLHLKLIKKSEFHLAKYETDEGKKIKEKIKNTLSMSLKEKFEKYLNQSSGLGPDGNCWEWVGYRDRAGYGLIRHLNRNLRAHRASYILFYGEFDQSLYVCHKCDNPSCVRPSHLFLGTPKDNTRDMISKNRQYKMFGESHPQAKINSNKVKTIRALYKTGKYSYSKLHNIFPEISRWSIESIINNKGWKHINVS